MNAKLLSRLDRISAALLLLWAGMALGIAALAAPIAFQQIPSRDLAGRVIGACFRRIDLLSWFAFSLPFLLSYLPRWLVQVKEPGIGPLRLWSAAMLAALFMCFTSMVIVNPRLDTIRARSNASMESLSEDAPDQGAFRRAHSLSKQLLGLRMLLALVLAIGVFHLPKGEEEPVPENSPGA